MIKKWIYYTSIAIVAAFLSFGFTASKVGNQPVYTSTTEATLHIYPSLEPEAYTHSNIPFTGKTFTGFKEALAFKESQGRYRLINTLGYMGKYQFGVPALRAIGVHNTHEFLNNPRMQERAFKALLAKNKWELRKEIEQYDGKIINGFEVTESGILAAAHLGGAGSVKKYFKSQGKKSIKDDYGTSLKSYMKKFGGYDTSFIKADSNARIKKSKV